MATKQPVLILMMVFCGLLGLGANVLAAPGAPLTPKAGFDMAQVERGRYLARVSGCNDCHTATYALRDGEVPEDTWLLGDVFGWRGPWGTTYSSNLRLFIAAMAQDQWLEYSRQFRTRPPMPWFNVRAMVDADLTAIYQFIRYLGPSGVAAPAYVPPDKEPAPPYALFPSPPSPQ